MQGNMISGKSSGESQEVIDEIILTKNIELKDSNSEIFEIEFNLRKYTISLQSKKKLIANSPIYFLNLDIKQFHKLNKFFLQYESIDELFGLISDMKEEEFVINYSNESLNLIFKIEQRKKIIDIPFKLKRKDVSSDKAINEKIEILIKENQNLKNEFDLFKEKCLNEIEKLNLRISSLERENKELKEKNNIIGNNDLIFKESKIIIENEDKEFLKYCLSKEKMKTKLLYSARIDGDYIDAFNKKCDGKDNTLSIIKTDNGKIIGGFFKKKLSVKDDYYDPDCFLFSVNYKEKYNVNPNGTEKNYSFYGTGSPSAIIDFGYGSSIHVVDNCLNDNNNYYRGREGTFKFPSKRITQGDILFKVIEFEVYQIMEI